MEKIYPRSQFNCSEPVKLKYFFDKYASFTNLENIPNPKVNSLKTTAIFNYLGLGAELSRQEQKEIEQMCRPENLMNPGDHVPEEIEKLDCDTVINLLHPIPVTDKARELKSVQVKDLGKKTIDNYFYRRNAGKEAENLFKKSKKSSVDDIKPGSNYIVSVRVHQPFVFKYGTKNKSSIVKLSQEILALGSNRLSQVRDLIQCEAEAITQDSDEFKTEDSNFIFIENTFYNDLRRGKSAADSDSIIKWASEKDIEGFNKASMDGTYINDLTISIGYPYVYVHRDGCEHVVVFSDARLINKSDSLYPYDYPFCNKLKKRMHNVCKTCGLVNAEWICLKSNRLPNDITYMCDDCFKSYNYIGDKKIDDFVAFPIKQKTEPI